MKHSMITLTLLTTLFASGAGAMSADMKHNHETMPPTATATFGDVAAKDMVEVTVNGLVCDFCARALEKVFSKREEVRGIHVDLDQSLVLIAMKEGQTLDDATLTQLVTDSGYNVTAIKRGE